MSPKRRLDKRTPPRNETLEGGGEGEKERKEFLEEIDQLPRLLLDFGLVMQCAWVPRRRSFAWAAKSRKTPEERRLDALNLPPSTPSPCVHRSSRSPASPPPPPPPPPRLSRVR